MSKLKQPKEQPKSVQQQLDQEIALLKSNAEKVKRLLINKDAEDLIPMLLDNLDEIYPVRELSDSPNGARVSRKRK